MSAKFSIEFRGLMMLVATPERTSVVCIDVGADRSGHVHPRHVPTFEVSRFEIQPGSSAPDATYASVKAAWNLDGAVVQMFPIGKPPTSYVRPQVTLTKPGTRTEPPQNPDDWNGVEWILDFRAALPGATLRPDWATCPAVQARIDLSGGTIRGMEAEGAMQNAVWRFGKAPEQIFTTRFVYDIPAETDGFEIRMEGPSRRRTAFLKPRESGSDVFATVYHFPMIEHVPGDTTARDCGPHGHDGGHAARAGADAASRADRLPDITHATACYELFTQPAGRPIPEFVRFAGAPLRAETSGCVPGGVLVP